MLMIVFITLRESMEMLLVILALISYTNKLSKRNLFNYIYSGALCGLAASIILGCILFNHVKNFQGSTGEFFSGFMMILISILIIYYMVWMRKQKVYLGTNIDKKYGIKATAIGFFLFSFLTIFRECIEIIVFILPKFNMDVITILIGIVIGASSGVLIISLIYDATTKLNINTVFTVLTFILILIGTVMFSEGFVVLMPASDNSLQSAAALLYAIPAIFIFLKGIIGDYLKYKA